MLRAVWQGLVLSSLCLMLSACASNRGDMAELPVASAVFCLDEGRGVVTRTVAGDCRGKIISREEAIERDRQREARARISQVQPPGAKLFAGLRVLSAGTGFAVNGDGDVLTSAHVIRGCAAVAVRHGESGELIPAAVAAMDEGIDLALLRIGRTMPRFAIFAPNRAAHGTPGALVGYPKEGMIRRSPKLTPIHVDYGAGDLQTGDLGLRGEVRHGNSGGPVIDSRGQVIGLLKSTIDTQKAFELSGQVLTNYGRAIERTLVIGWLSTQGSRFHVASAPGRELSGKEIFEQAMGYVVRVDCMGSAPNS